MVHTTAGPAGDGWKVIERERWLDRWVRRVCASAWIVTVALAAVYAGFVVQQVLDQVRRQQVGLATGTAVLASLTPLVVTLGILALLVAMLSTVGVFLRFRTASLSEIQLRLAALETMLLEGRGKER